MTVREFTTRLNKINEYLSDFPPSNENNKLLMDKLMDIAKFSVPAMWQKTMIMHGFDPANHTIQEFIEFYERIEFAEGNEQHAQLK
jgi:wyosine [tRNA(Phe)-imidazoG37] synthetase (radical SAM superfamily)